MCISNGVVAALLLVDWAITAWFVWLVLVAPPSTLADTSVRGDAADSAVHFDRVGRVIFSEGYLELPIDIDFDRLLHNCRWNVVEGDKVHRFTKGIDYDGHGCCATGTETCCAAILAPRIPCQQLHAALTEPRDFAGNSKEKRFAVLGALGMGALGWVANEVVQVFSGGHNVQAANTDAIHENHLLLKTIAHALNEDMAQWEKDFNRMHAALATSRFEEAAHRLVDGLHALYANFRLTPALLEPRHAAAAWQEIGREVRRLGFEWRGDEFDFYQLPAFVDFSRSKRSKEGPYMTTLNVRVLVPLAHGWYDLFRLANMPIRNSNGTAIELKDNNVIAVSHDRTNFALLTSDATSHCVRLRGQPPFCARPVVFERKFENHCVSALFAGHFEAAFSRCDVAPFSAPWAFAYVGGGGESVIRTYSQATITAHEVCADVDRRDSSRAPPIIIPRGWAIIEGLRQGCYLAGTDITLHSGASVAHGHRRVEVLVVDPDGVAAKALDHRLITIDDNTFKSDWWPLWGRVAFGFAITCGVIISLVGIYVAPGCGVLHCDKLRSMCRPHDSGSEDNDDPKPSDPPAV